MQTGETAHFISKRYDFESAHFLPHVPEGHKCKRLHGHHYVIDVTLSGAVDDIGWLMDFWDLDRVVEPIIEQIDHRCLNDIAGLENPTAELISRWFWSRIERDLGRNDIALHEVKVWETPTCCATLIRKNFQTVN